MLLLTNIRMLGVAILILGAGSVGVKDALAARTVLSLDGEWNFATDPVNRGETEGWYLPATHLRWQGLVQTDS